MRMQQEFLKEFLPLRCTVGNAELYQGEISCLSGVCLLRPIAFILVPVNQCVIFYWRSLTCCGADSPFRPVLSSLFLKILFFVQLSPVLYVVNSRSSGIPCAAWALPSKNRSAFSPPAADKNMKHVMPKSLSFILGYFCIRYICCSLFTLGLRENKVTETLTSVSLASVVTAASEHLRILAVSRAYQSYQLSCTLTDTREVLAVGSVSLSHDSETKTNICLLRRCHLFRPTLPQYMFDRYSCFFSFSFLSASLNLINNSFSCHRRLALMDFPFW